jgi:gamma-glutamylcyclotransferase (GGCT)/AIG2-like uncharacterized protein YtfP
MTDQYLFVYGTLLKGAENMMSNYLKSKSTFVSEGLMPGSLYKVDFYPGAVHELDSGRMIMGELYHLHEPEKALEVLDTYEGYDTKQAEQSLFIREQVEVFAQETKYLSWVFLYNLPTDELLLIESGDFLRFDMESHV